MHTMHSVLRGMGAAEESSCLLFGDAGGCCVGGMGEHATQVRTTTPGAFVGGVNRDSVSGGFIDNDFVTGVKPSLPETQA